MSFTRMHNDYLDLDKAGLNDEQPTQLHEDGALKGHGKRGHGLNGKDADLNPGGQNRVTGAWWFSDGTIRIAGRRYASLVPYDTWTEEQMELAQEIVCCCEYPGEWDGDYWVLGEEYNLEAQYDNNDDKTEDENLACALGVAYRVIVEDSEAFENEMASLSAAFDEIK